MYGRIGYAVGGRTLLDLHNAGQAAMSDFDALAVIKAGIRGAAVNVPGLATWIQVWCEHESLELERRVDRYWRAFVHEAELNDRKFQAMASDIRRIQEGVAIMKEALSLARDDPAEEKQEVYAQAAAHVITELSLTLDQKIAVIDTVEVLTFSDIELLRSFGSHPFKVENLPGTRNPHQLGMVVSQLSKLEARGLIGETNPPAVSAHAYAGDPSHWRNRWRAKYFEVLPFGNLFLSMTTPTEA